MTTAANPPTQDPPRRRRPRLLRVLRVVGGLGLAAAIFVYLLGSAADFAEVRAAISSMTGAELATLGLLGAWNLVTYWIVVVAVTPGLTYRQAAVLVESTTAVANAVPGGSAVAVGLTYGMLGSWGFSRSRSTLSVVVSGLWNNFAKLGLPVLSLALLAMQGNASGPRVTAGLFGIVALAATVSLFSLVLRQESFARRAGDTAGGLVSHGRRRIGKAPVEGWGEATVKFRARTIGLIGHAWKRLTVATLVSHLSLFAVLLVALRHIGVADDEVNWVEVLAVFSFVRLLTAIPVTPGGLGVVELGLIAGLTAAGGPSAEVVGGVLAYRGLTYLLPIPIGLLTYLYWRRNTSWRDSAPPLSPSVAPASVG